jgi:hypothetical protein
MDGSDAEQIALSGSMALRVEMVGYRGDPHGTFLAVAD